MNRRISCILLGLLLLTSVASAQDSSTPTPQTYTVAPGDTLSSIALRYHTTIDALVRANAIANPNRVIVGAILIIPGDAGDGSYAIVSTEPGPTATKGPSPTATAQASPTATEAAPSTTPAATSAPLATTLPSIGFEVGGEIFSFDHLDALHAAAMAWAKVAIESNTNNSIDAAKNAIDLTHKSSLKILLEISGDGQAFHADPAGYTQRFAAYLGQVAALAPDAIEVWSGMNADKISAADYGQLLSAAFLAIKKANLKVLVISGALGKTNSLGGQCTSSGCGDIPYLNALADAGIGNVADCVGMHYTLGAVSPDDSSGDPRGDQFDYYYPTLVSAYATVFPTKQLCFTELGYVVTGQVPLANRFAWAQNTTPELRAEWLTRAGLLASQSGRIRLMIVYNMDANAPNGDNPDTSYAIVSPNGDCSACSMISTISEG